jgi:hypothetical protein
MTSTKKNGLLPTELIASLEDLYARLVNSNEGPQESRALCDILFKEAFSQVNVKVSGLENLPKTSGHIFILNHHLVNPLYTLSNGFQITLDTHFLSSLLAEHYQPGNMMRIVREGGEEESAHTNYFNQLGFITVRSQASDQQQRRENLQQFYKNATEVLLSGKNIIICPEGTSNTHEESPSDFKAGAFKLAASLDTNALIIPVAIAYFDKTFTHHTPALMIHPPIKMDKQLLAKEPKNLSAYIVKVQNDYKIYVKQVTKFAEQ